MGAKRKTPERWPQPVAGDIEVSCARSDLCVCRDIVRRTHAGMLDKGADAGSAIEAAIRVFRYHHPETGRMASRDLVEQWVLGHQLH